VPEGCVGLYIIPHSHKYSHGLISALSPLVSSYYRLVFPLTQPATVYQSALLLPRTHLSLVPVNFDSEFFSSYIAQVAVVGDC
jgi:hypothetical protein